MCNRLFSDTASIYAIYYSHCGGIIFAICIHCSRIRTTAYVNNIAWCEVQFYSESTITTTDNYYLRLAKDLRIPKWISPWLLKWPYKIAFSGMSPNTCACIIWVAVWQTQWTIGENSIRNWRWQTLDEMTHVSLTTVMHMECINI